jgi:hypothetical protein
MVEALRVMAAFAKGKAVQPNPRFAFVGKPIQPLCL